MMSVAIEAPIVMKQSDALARRQRDELTKRHVIECKRVERAYRQQEFRKLPWFTRVSRLLCCATDARQNYGKTAALASRGVGDYERVSETLHQDFEDYQKQDVESDANKPERRAKIIPDEAPFAPSPAAFEEVVEEDEEPPPLLPERNQLSAADYRRRLLSVVQERSTTEQSPIETERPREGKLRRGRSLRLSPVVKVKVYDNTPTLDNFEWCHGSEIDHNKRLVKVLQQAHGGKRSAWIDADEEMLARSEGFADVETWLLHKNPPKNRRSSSLPLLRAAVACHHDPLAALAVSPTSRKPKKVKARGKSNNNNTPVAVPSPNFARWTSHDRRSKSAATSVARKMEEPIGLD